MRKIMTAAALLREITKNTTDSAAFRVEVYKDERCDEIYLTPDYKRRGEDWWSGTTFYHSREVVMIAEALGLHYFISAVYDNENRRAEFRVRLYCYNN